MPFAHSMRPVRRPRTVAAMLAMLGLALAGAVQARAAFLDPSWAGASSYDGWDNLVGASYPDYGLFPGNSAWPAPIGSNTAASGDAELSRVAGGTSGGGPFPATEAIYFGSSSSLVNLNGGTLRVSDPTPLSTARTILLQIQIGEAAGYDFHQPTGYPVLQINGGPALQPQFRQLLNRYQNGVFPNPVTGDLEPVYVNSWGLQWNVNGLGPITSLAITFSGANHAQVYRLRLDQSQDLVTGNIFLPDVRLALRGTPSYNGVETTVTHGFQGPANSEVVMNFNESLAGGVWSPAGTHSTGPAGTFNATISQPGDHRLPWSRSMFFRAQHVFSD